METYAKGQYKCKEIISEQCKTELPDRMFRSALLKIKKKSFWMGFGEWEMGVSLDWDVLSPTL